MTHRLASRYDGTPNMSAAGDREFVAIRADCLPRIALPFRAAPERWRPSGGSLKAGDVHHAAKKETDAIAISTPRSH